MSFAATCAADAIFAIGAGRVGLCKLKLNAAATFAKAATSTTACARSAGFCESTAPLTGSARFAEVIGRKQPDIAGTSGLRVQASRGAGSLRRVTGELATERVGSEATRLGIGIREFIGALPELSK